MKKYTEKFYLSEIFPFKKNTRDKWEVKKKSKQNENSDDEDVVLACAKKTLVCAAKTEHLLKKKSEKETRGWGVGLWKIFKYIARTPFAGSWTFQKVFAYEYNNVWGISRFLVFFYSLILF